MGLMGANQSKPGQRPRQTKSNPPPPYYKGVNTTATPKHDGPQKPGTEGLSANPQRAGEQCTAELVAKLESLERAVSELQRADQVEVIEKEKQSLKEQKRNLEEQKSSLEREKRQWGKERDTLEKDKKRLEEQRNRLEGCLEERESALERSDKRQRSYADMLNKMFELSGVQRYKMQELRDEMRELRDDLQKVSTEAVKAKALLGKGNDQAVSVEPCQCTQDPGS